MVSVKLLGAGCSKCQVLEQRLLGLKSTHNLNFDLVKITDLDEIISYGIMMTPGLVINGKLKSVGTVPKDAALLQWLQENAT
jgi:small redox-active disulfide protein 2